MPHRSPRHDLLNQFAEVAKALGHSNRLDLLEMLAQGERAVEALARVSGLSVANTSQHLRVLARAGLVISRRDGVKIHYSLSGGDVIDLLGALRKTAERHIADVDRVIEGYFRERDSLEAISRNELLSRSRAGTVTVLDVRPAEEFANGHLPGAVNVPLPDLLNRLDEIPEGQDIIAYCRGPYCVLAFDAVAMLRKKGLSARRLQDGYPEWKAAGLPVEVGIDPSL